MKSFSSFTFLFLLINFSVFSQLPSYWTGGIPIPQTEYAQNAIQKYIDQYTQPFGKQQLFDVLNGGESYRLYIRQELKKRNMPAVLEYLPVVESDYNPLAVSRSGARGLWQFMDNSIEGLLKKTEYYDERYDPWKSTDAALKKLQENYKQFKDWPVAIAAYNCGAGAMKKILKNAKEKSFWFIAENELLRDQSTKYVPKLLAISLLVEHSQFYDIPMPEISTSSRYAEFDYLQLNKSIYLERLSSELKIDIGVLKQLNPELLKDCTPPYQYKLRLPSGLKDSAWNAVYDILSEEIPDWKKKHYSIHIVKKGETLWSISRQYKIKTESLQSFNNLSDSEVLSIGKTLYIPQ